MKINNVIINVIIDIDKLNELDIAIFLRPRFRDNIYIEKIGSIIVIKRVIVVLVIVKIFF